MLRFLLSAVCAAAVLIPPAVSAQAVDRREVGNLIFDNVPAIPQSLGERLDRYENSRSAAFRDWLADGSMLISTRFGQVDQLHRVKGPGMDRTQLTFAGEPIGEVAAQPGTDRYVFSRDTGGDEYHQGYAAGLAGPEARLTEPGTRNQGFRFSPDGKVLMWSRVSRGDPDYDIVLMKTRDPSSRRVVLEGRGAMAPLDMTADGKTMLVGRYLSAAVSERYLLDVASGRLTRLLPDRSAAFGGGRFVRDGRAVIFTADFGTETQRLVELDLATGGIVDLTPDLRWNVEDFDVSDDGRRLAWSVNEDGISKVFVRELVLRRALPQPDLPAGVVGALRFSPDGERLAIGLSAPKGADVWTWGVTSGRLERWTFSELGGLDSAEIAEPSLIRVKSFDGLSVPAFVYRPKEIRGRAPVIISIHGGPEGQSRPSFNPAIQSWIEELGAVVVVPNVRGSAGYGKTYLSLDNAEKREDSVRDIGAILDWIAAQPDLDPRRVAVMGASYGGYMTLATLAHYADRLAGAVDTVGISNFVTFLENTEGYRRDLRRAEYGDERDPKMRAVFDRISPIHHTDRMTKPLLVVQGRNDPRVPYTESEQIVAQVRARGGEVWYLLAKDEGHGFRKKQNQDAEREVRILFLRKVFGLELK